MGYIGGSKANTDSNDADEKPDSLFENYESSMGNVTVKNCVNNANIKSMRTASSHALPPASARRQPEGGHKRLRHL